VSGEVNASLSNCFLVFLTSSSVGEPFIVPPGKVNPVPAAGYAISL
jgi:hypothetical protein